MESLLETIPDHEGLLIALCQGYTQYAYAFVQSEGDLLVNTDYARATALHERAYRLFLRARGSDCARSHAVIAASRIRSRSIRIARPRGSMPRTSRRCTGPRRAGARRSRWARTDPRCSPTCRRSARS
jgi:hypothetical protein